MIIYQPYLGHVVQRRENKSLENHIINQLNPKIQLLQERPYLQRMVKQIKQQVQRMDWEAASKKIIITSKQERLKNLEFLYHQSPNNSQLCMDLAQNNFIKKNQHITIKHTSFGLTWKDPRLSQISDLNQTTTNQFIEHQGQKIEKVCFNHIKIENQIDNTKEAILQKLKNIKRKDDELSFEKFEIPQDITDYLNTTIQLAKNKRNREKKILRNKMHQKYQSVWNNINLPHLKSLPKQQLKMNSYSISPSQLNNSQDSRSGKIEEEYLLKAMTDDQQAHYVQVLQQKIYKIKQPPKD